VQETSFFSAPEKNAEILRCAQDDNVCAQDDTQTGAAAAF